VEDITIRHSIVAGNTLNDSADDLFTGSVLHFYSHGYNRIGKPDFSQILVPIPPWWSLSRKHWPKAGDADNVALSDVLDIPGAVRHASIASAGTDNGQLALLWYPPKGNALDRIPGGGYTVDDIVMAEYEGPPGTRGEFLVDVLDKLDADYGGALLENGFGANYRAAFESMHNMPVDNVTWYESPAGWPSDSRNYPWIDFWRGLDNAIAGRLGAVGLGDDFWRSYGTGQIVRAGNILLKVSPVTRGPFLPNGVDQRGNPRPNGTAADIGAIEL
jgi:hypothetical protein